MQGATFVELRRRRQVGQGAFTPRLSLNAVALLIARRRFTTISAAIAQRIPLEVALGAYLAGDTAIAGLVGDRVFCGLVNELVIDQLPVLAFYVVSRPRLFDLDGDSGMVKARVQVNCMGRNGLEGEALQYAAISAIVRIPNPMQGLGIAAVFTDDGEMDLDAPPPGSDSTRSDYQFEFFIHFYETAD